MDKYVVVFIGMVLLNEMKVQLNSGDSNITSELVLIVVITEYIGGHLKCSGLFQIESNRNYLLKNLK